MKTKEDFVKVIDQTAEKYDQVAALRRAGDPRYFQHQEAMATMFAMLSQQLEIGMMEPFDKVRDATVLADAALKGVIPKASPARVRLIIKNQSKGSDFLLAAGRRVADSSGLAYEIDSPVVVSAAASDTEPGMGYADAVQKVVRKVEHTVTESVGFYGIEVPAAEDGRYIAAISVEDSIGNTFKYAPGFTNVWPSDRVYHIESDAYQRLYVKFGLDGVVGYQPFVGEKLTLILTESSGDVRPAMGSQFNLEYAYTPADSQITIEFSELLVAGENPIGITELRELCRYPSTYDDSAVYLGEFDFLVRRQMPRLPFLSIWNEQIEEKVRGASVDNINRIFISFQAQDGVNPTETLEQAKRIIFGADDSFDVLFVAPIHNPIAIKVSAQIARIHDLAAVNQQIKQAILNEYGRDSALSRRGMVILQFKRVYEFLRSTVNALQDEGSDFSVTITPPSAKLLPEHWRYVSDASLTVTVAASDYNIENWGR